MTRNDSVQRSTSRRTVLKLAGGSLAMGSAGLAGCAGQPEGPDDGNSEGGYPQNEIEWIIPYSTGGGFDAYSRALAEFMPQYIEGEPEIVPENRTGAGGVVGANRLANSPADGSVVGIANIPGFIVSQLLQDTEYDLREMSWFGRISQEQYVYVVSADDPAYESIEEMQAADEVRFPETDLGSTGSLAGILSANVMDINAEFITGYAGSSEQITSLLRGDTDVMCSHSTLATPIENGEVEPIAVVDGVHPWYISEDVPLATDLGFDELDGVIRQLRAAAGPPGMEDDVVGMLEDAMKEAAESDEMQQWGEDSDRRIDHAGADDTAESIESGFSLMQEYEDVFSGLLEG